MQPEAIFVVTRLSMLLLIFPPKKENEKIKYPAFIATTRSENALPSKAHRGGYERKVVLRERAQH